jgi:hypothetical protein
MSMRKILLKSLRSEIQYQGRFSRFAFGLLAPPTALYENLLKHLARYGGTLQSLSFKAEQLSLADAGVNCFLTELNTIIYVRLDRLEINFFKLNEIGVETANQILLASWAAIHEADASIAILEHVVGVTLHAQIQGASYDELIGRYVTMPPGLKDTAHAGIAFYLPEAASEGERLGNIVLDRLAGGESLNVKLTVAFDTQQVPVELLAQRVDEYMIRTLDSLALEVERENA